nr:MAG TPA: hypothetical protein [Caudoviricetes sp.]DAY01636.1 MAG TPA: hypothetical protein [Caudoviricetes sp.]
MLYLLFHNPCLLLPFCRNLYYNYLTHKRKIF